MTLLVLSHLPLGLYLVVVAALSLFGAHMGFLLWLGRRMTLGSTPPRTVPLSPAAFPRVTVQLPIYNERYVADRGIRALAGLEWPRDRLQIQVLDDSTDDTTTIARQAVDELRAAGHDIVLLHRAQRDGFKAGALAAGLPSATGEFVAMFDADFLPAPDFLMALLVRRTAFADSRVGFVQARWSFLNRDVNLLTRAQAVMHDPHFFVEQPVRCQQGWTFNFNGSGGIWRRACIDDAGGWIADTLTEDLDLSYRAFLRGWKATYEGDVLAPNELPEDIFSFKRQQARWARGSIQCARKLLGPVWRSPKFSWGSRVIATVHLLGYSLHLFLLAFVLLWPVCQLMPYWFPGTPGFPDWLLWFAPLGVCYPVVMVCSQLVQRGPWSRVWLDFPLAAWLGVGLGFANSFAVLEGFFRAETGVFVRTPKPAGASLPARGIYRARADWTMGFEALIVVALAGLGVEMWAKDFRLWALGPFFYGGGYLFILILQVRELAGRRQARPAAAVSNSAPSVPSLASITDE